MPPVLRYLGFGLESTFAEAVPPAFHVDISGATLDSPSGTEMYYAGGLGRGDRTRRPGYYVPSGNIVYAWDVRTIAHLFYVALGGYQFTADMPLNTHEIFGVDETELPSFTARLGKDVFEHVFSGCVVSGLDLALADEFLVATADVTAAGEAPAPLEAVADLLLPEEFPLAFHEVTLELPTETDLSADVRALGVRISNSLSADAGKGVGSRFPRRLPVGGREVTLSLDLWYEDLAQKERFWGASGGPSADGAEDFPARIVADAGDDGTVTIDIESAHFTQVGISGSGRDEIVQSTAIKAMIAPHTLADLTEVDTELLCTVTNGADDLEEGLIS